MAEQQTSADSETHGERRVSRFSPGLFLTGLLALLISVGILVGPDHWELTSIIPAGWIMVAAAIVIGLFLVISPRKRR